MSALPPKQMRTMRKTAEQATHPLASLVERWKQLHAQAAELAALAQLGPDTGAPSADDFAQMLDEAQGWQRDMAWRAMEDIDAMMQPGLTALRVITARGQDAGAPAMALWREFYCARKAVLETIAAQEAVAA